MIAAIMPASNDLRRIAGGSTMKRRSLLASLVLLAAGCATGPQFYSDFDPAADFGRYHTYCWAYTQVPAGMDPFLVERLQAAVDRSLAARGLQRVDAGELAVGFNLGTRINIDSGYYGGYNYYPGWGPTAYTEGELTINIYDNASRRPIWHGVVSQEIVSDGPIDWAKLNHAVDVVMNRFPPPPPKA
jgi:hypothetical protein